LLSIYNVYYMLFNVIYIELTKENFPKISLIFVDYNIRIKVKYFTQFIQD